MCDVVQERHPFRFLLLGTEPNEDTVPDKQYAIRVSAREDLSPYEVLAFQVTLMQGARKNGGIETVLLSLVLLRMFFWVWPGGG